jgi:hypothetical protein
VSEGVGVGVVGCMGGVWVWCMGVVYGCGVWVWCMGVVYGLGVQGVAWYQK